MIRQIIDKSAFFLTYLKFMKIQCIKSCMNILTPFFNQKNLAFEKVVALSLFLMVMLEKIQRIEGQGRRIWDIFHWPL